MIVAGVLALMAVAMFGPAGAWLDRCRWPERAPRAGVALWQAIGINGALAAVGSGLALAVAPLHRGLAGGLAELIGAARQSAPINGFYEACGLTLALIVLAVLASGLVVTATRTISMRRRHRILLDLVSVRCDRVPGVALLEDPRAAAYCVPGVRSRIVISAGAVDLLDREQLEAVVEHERGHVQERHDLVLLPFSSMIEMLDWMPYVARAPKAVAGLLEMAADDYAARTYDRRVIASALVDIAGRGFVPTCAFAADAGSVTRRVHRLIAPRPGPVPAVAGVTAAVLIAAWPLAVMGLA